MVLNKSTHQNLVSSRKFGLRIGLAQLLSKCTTRSGKAVIRNSLGWRRVSRLAPTISAFLNDKPEYKRFVVVDGLNVANDGDFLEFIRTQRGSSLLDELRVCLTDSGAGRRGKILFSRSACLAMSKYTSGFRFLLVTSDSGDQCWADRPGENLLHVHVAGPRGPRGHGVGGKLELDDLMVVEIALRLRDSGRPFGLLSHDGYDFMDREVGWPAFRCRHNAVLELDSSGPERWQFVSGFSRPFLRL